MARNRISSNLIKLSLLMSICSICGLMILLSEIQTDDYFISQLHSILAKHSQVFNKTLTWHQSTPASIARNHALQHPRVALCLVGGARDFELTAEGILRHVIEARDDVDWVPDVFLHAPLDGDAHKFTLLGNASEASGRLASARIFRPNRIPESALHEELLDSGTSPNGIQGLLQYFHLVEGCLGLIAAHEIRHGFLYDWVVRTRVDGYWTGAPITRPLDSFNASTYYVPVGSQFGGLNDRFGLGGRAASAVALSRLSLLQVLHKAGRRKLNSESAFRAQLEELRVPAETIALPFCILSRRRYQWPMEGPSSIPVASIATPGPLSGAKCRPCMPAAAGTDAEQSASKLSKQWGWPGEVQGLTLCNGSGDWEVNWRDSYAAAAGRQFEQQQERVMSRTRRECEADVVRFAAQWEAWESPPAAEICSQT